MTDSIITEKNIQILEILLDSGDIHQKEMAKKIDLSDAGTKLVLKKLEDAKIIKTYLSRDNGRIVKKIKLKLNPDDVKGIIESYKETRSKLKNAVAALQRPKLKKE